MTNQTITEHYLMTEEGKALALKLTLYMQLDILHTVDV